MKNWVAEGIASDVNDFKSVGQESCGIQLAAASNAQWSQNILEKA